jgi:hypothetical protein
LFVIAATLIILAFLAFIGLKKEAKKIINVIFEGTLSILDILEFIDLLWKVFIKLLKEFILFVSPLFAILLVIIIYLYILTFYKEYGRDNDVTGLTVILTIVLVTLSGLVSLPKHKNQGGNLSWINRVIKRFSNFFRDGLEVLILVFFFTMDSTNLFFLPPDLNHPIFAILAGHDLMKTSITVDADFLFSLTLIIGAIGLEILRVIIILIHGGIQSYQEGKKIMIEKNYSYAPVKLFKAAMKKSFMSTIDDFLKFTVFTTFIVLVFIFFPRLKLLSMIVSSCTNVILDLIFTQRLKMSYGEDLISRIIVYVARLK